MYEGNVLMDMAILVSKQGWLYTHAIVSPYLALLSAKHTILYLLVTTYLMYRRVLNRNPQVPGEAYLPLRGNCRARLIFLFLFRWLHLNRNAAKVPESLKISDTRMAKLLSVVFFEVATV